MEFMKETCKGCGHKRENHAQYDDGDGDGQYIDYMECLMHACPCQVYEENYG